MPTNTRSGSRLRRLAKEWARTAKKLAKLEDKKQALGEILLYTMKRRNQLVVEIGGSAVRFVAVWSKRPTKTDVVKFFGLKSGEKFWKKLPAIPSEYLSLVRLDV